MTARAGEHDRHFALLTAPVGPTGSGAARYGAAMYFYDQGQLPAALLEIYRRCFILDDEDPVDLAQFEGLSLPPILTGTA